MVECMRISVTLVVTNDRRISKFTGNKNKLKFFLQFLKCVVASLLFFALSFEEVFVKRFNRVHFRPRHSNVVLRLVPIINDLFLCNDFPVWNPRVPKPSRTKPKTDFPTPRFPAMRTSPFSISPLRIRTFSFNFSNTVLAHCLSHSWTKIILCRRSRVTEQTVGSFEYVAHFAT